MSQQSAPKPRSTTTQMGDQRSLKSASSQIGDRGTRVLPGGRAGLNKKGSQTEEGMRTSLKERLASQPQKASTPEFLDGSSGGERTIDAAILPEDGPGNSPENGVLEQANFQPALEPSLSEAKAPDRCVQEANALLNVGGGLRAPSDVAARLEALTINAMEESNAPHDLAVAKQLEAACQLCSTLRSLMAEQEQRLSPAPGDASLRRSISDNVPRAVYAFPSTATSSIAAPTAVRLEGISSAGGIPAPGKRIEGLSSAGGLSAAGAVFSAAGGSSSMITSEFGYNASLTPLGSTSPRHSLKASPGSTLRSQGIASGRVVSPSGVSRTVVSPVTASRTPSPLPRSTVVTTLVPTPTTPRIERKMSPVQVRRRTDRQESPMVVRQAAMPIPAAQRGFAGYARVDSMAPRLVSSSPGQAQVAATLSPRTASQHRRYEPQSEVLRR